MEWIKKNKVISFLIGYFTLFIGASFYYNSTHRSWPAYVLSSIFIIAVIIFLKGLFTKKK